MMKLMHLNYSLKSLPTKFPQIQLLKMLEKLIKTNDQNHRWFASRLETRLDQIWLGGVLFVSILVCWLLDIRFIPTFLIGYLYLFLFFSRKTIVDNYPPTGDSIIRFASPNKHLLPQTKIRFETKSDYLLPIFCLMFLLYASAGITNILNLSPQILSAVIANLGLGWAFLFRHKELFSAYSGDTKLKFNLVKFILAYVRLVGSAVSFATVLLLWSFVLFMFASGWFAPEFIATGSLGDRYAIFAPIAVNFLLFHLSVSFLLSIED